MKNTNFFLFLINKRIELSKKMISKMNALIIKEVQHQQKLNKQKQKILKKINN